MPLAGAGELGLTWVVEPAFCARTDNANRQEKAPVNRTLPHVAWTKKVLIIGLRNKIILGQEKERDYCPEALTATLPSFTPT